jgi:hypothetical protein
MSQAPTQPKTYSHVRCNDCGGQRNHAVRSSVYLSGGENELDEDGHLAPFDVVEVLQCLGCDSVTIRRVVWRGGRYYTTQEGEYVGDGEEITYWPPRTVWSRPEWVRRLPPAIQPILNEVYTAFDAGAPILAAFGVRTVLDVLALEVVGDIGSFQQKLDALEARGWISRLDNDRLSIVIDAGSAAAHRAFRATPEALAHMMESTEHLLKARYVLDPAAKELEKMTPKRQPKK